MTRRIVVAIMSVTLAALMLAGAGTLLLARFGARQETEQRLEREVRDVADGLQSLAQAEDQGGANGTTTSPAAQARVREALQRLVRRVLRLDGIAVVRVRGAIVIPADDLPAGVTSADVIAATTRLGQTTSGSHGSTTFAALAVESPGESFTVVVATAPVDRSLGPAAKWFGWAALVAVLLAASVALKLSRRLTAPLHAVEVTAHRIAAGDLRARAPEPNPGARDELSQLARGVNQMAASLQRSRAVEDQFLMSVSHDLRTPLTSIKGYAEAIVDGAVEDVAGAGVVIGSEANRLERLVRDLLELSKLRSTGFSLELRRVDLAAVATSVARGVGARVSVQDVPVAVAVDASRPVMVNGDPDRLGQVVANLMDNAVRFARGAVSISVSETNRQATIVVDDDGPGIAPEDLPHVFERMYVSKHQPERAESGSGLGLAIVAELVAAHGGTVEAQVAPTGGARMLVRLPCL
jgi:two-component system, OmpR family, sensor kinase